MTDIVKITRKNMWKVCCEYKTSDEAILHIASQIDIYHMSLERILNVIKIQHKIHDTLYGKLNNLDDPFGFLMKHKRTKILRKDNAFLNQLLQEYDLLRHNHLKQPYVEKIKLEDIFKMVKDIINLAKIIMKHFSKQNSLMHSLVYNERPFDSKGKPPKPPKFKK